MSTQTERPSLKPIAELTREELFALFQWYDFKDPLGHALINCQDFIELVERAVEPTA
jgi:hypothetical protein